MKSTIKTDKLFNDLTANFDRINQMIEEIQTSNTRSSIYAASDVIRMLANIRDENRIHINNIIDESIDEYVNPVNCDAGGNVEDIVKVAIDKSLVVFKQYVSDSMESVCNYVDFDDHCSLDHNGYGSEITISININDDDIVYDLGKGMDSVMNSLSISDIEAEVQEAVKKQLSESSADTNSSDNQ